MTLNKLKQRVPSPLRPLIEKIERSPLGRRLARGVFWNTLGTTLSRGLALISTIVVARFLGKETFGEFSIIQSTVMMFATYATFSMGLTANKHIAEFKTTDPERAGRIAALTSLIATLSGSAVAILMITTAPFIATHLLAAPHLAGMVALSGIALTFTVINEAQLGTIHGLEAFKRLSKIEVLATVCTLPITLAAVYFFGLKGAVGGLILLNVFRVGLNTHGIRKEMQLAGISRVWNKLGSEMGVIWRFSFPALLAGAVYIPAIWAANVILVNSPNGYAEMGVFSAADRWRTAIKVLPSMIGGVSLPILSSLNGESRTTEFKRMLWRNVMLALGMSLAVAGPIALLSPWIMATYGPGFSEGNWVLVILCVVAATHAAYWIMGQSFASRGQVWTMFRLNVGWAAILITTMWFLQDKGAFGLALAYLLAETFRLVCGYCACRYSLQSHADAVPQNVENSQSPAK